MKPFSLFNYVQDYQQYLQEKGLTVTLARPPREAFYLQIPDIYSLPAKEAAVGPWVFVEQHITIEKYVDSNNPAMAPHGTCTYRHKSDPSLRCVIHDYINKNLVPNGCYQQRVIKTGPDGTETVVFSDNYTDGRMNATLPYPGIPLSIEQIKSLVCAGRRYFIQLHEMKSCVYLDLSGQIEKLEVEWATVLSDKNAENFISLATTTANRFCNVISKLNRYTDGRKNNTEIAIHRHLRALADHQARPPVLSVIDTDETTVFYDEDHTIPSGTFKGPDVVKERPEDTAVKTGIEHLIDKINAMNDDAETKDTPEFYSVLQELNTQLTIFEITRDSHEDQAFAREQRSRLSPDFLNLPALFESHVFDGNLDLVKAMFGVIDLRMDLIRIFSNLLETIEEGKNEVLCDKLIKIAFHFHEHSDAFRAFVVFKMSNQQYFYTNIYLSVLSNLCLSNKFKAFKMYLELGCSPEGRHSRIGRYAFNALQTILLLENSIPDIKPWVDALFQHGAVMTTTPNFISEYCRILAPIEGEGKNAVSIADSMAGFFNQVKQYPDKKHGVLTKTDASFNLSKKDKLSYDAISRKNNVLELAWNLYKVSKPEIIGLFTEYCDIKTCLLEFINITIEREFLAAFIPCTQGGAAFYPDVKTMEEHARKASNFSESKNIYGLEVNRNNTNLALIEQAMGPSATEDEMNKLMSLVSTGDVKHIVFSHNKTMRDYVYLNSKNTHALSLHHKHNLLETARVVYERFELLFTTLSNDAKRDFVKDMLKLAIGSGLIPKNESNTVKLYRAAIVANSLINPMLKDDYKMMIKLFINYGKQYGMMNKDTVTCETNVLHQVCTNLAALISKLDPFIQMDLSVEIPNEIKVIEQETGSAQMQPSPQLR